jgi:hypothetical protein
VGAAVRRGAIAAACLLLASAWTQAGTDESGVYHFTDVERIVAVGDLHGDYEQYLDVLASAGLVNARGKWTGGNTHLVQTGDVTDRGPDSRAIIDHLEDLKEQAERKGGRVHTLIGNHEAMNSYGDLRYVHPGEFEAFRGRNSERYREKQWEFHLEQLKQHKPEQFLVMDLDQYRLEWEAKIPLGWVEHRLAWAPDGEYGQLLLSNPVAVKINDTLFVHGGLAPDYCHLSLEEITARAHAQLQDYQHEQTGILNDENGPVWYRGLAVADETAFSATLDQILARYGASRVVVGHTPTGGVVWPRFDGRVVVNDTGIAAYYGGHGAYLELSGGTATAGYGEHRLALPETAEDRLDYLRQVIELNPDNQELRKRLAKLLAPVPETPQAEAEGDEEAPDGKSEQVPINPCICR